MRAITILTVLSLFLLASCDGDEAPQAPPEIDRMARAYLRAIESRDMSAIHTRLSAEGRVRVTALSMQPIFEFFAAGSPLDVRLIDAETATSSSPTPAERHRLTYSLEFPNNDRAYYFFEATIEDDDTTITGFQMDRRE